MNKDAYNNNEIRIYHSLLKNIPLTIACIAFALAGMLMIKDASVSLSTKILGGWLNIIFLGGGGMALFLVNLYNCIRHIPFFDN